MKLHEVDIAIIGGGMVGASLAALLPKHFKVMVLESFPIPPATETALVYQPSYDARSTALSHSSYEIFQEAGIWPLLEKHVQEIQDVHVSDKGYWGSTLLSHQQEQMQALGYVVENPWLGRTLMYVLQQKSNVTFCCPAIVEKLKPIADGAELIVKQGDEVLHIHAKLAVIADGARSKICADLGIHSNTIDYGHTAIVTNVSTSESHLGVAYERFTDEGPMALLPLIDALDMKNRSALIWTMPSSAAKELLADTNEIFLQKLQQRFGYRQGQFLKVGKRHGYPLVLSTATEQIRQHIVVLGNAAHSLHPVAGQGFNLALRDVKALCSILEKTANTNAEMKIVLGDITQLEQYLSQQKNDQVITTVFSDLLPSLFSRRQSAVVASRGLGLIGLDLMPPLKSAFVRFASGVRNGAI
jgi:2-octaprenyl-6-methoxyphenol hydroxylase